MGQLHLQIFSTLDGVGQAPGHPDEDRSGGFAFGGWQAPLSGTPEEGEEILGLIEGTDALLLGRTTYDIFAGHWPHQRDVIADRFNAIPKYVVSRSEPALDWAGSSLVGPDLSAAVAELRARHDRISVFGSLEVSRQLVEQGLFDVLHLLLYPVVLGTGKRLFADGMIPSGLELLDPPVSTAKGAVLFHLGPADRPTTGDMRVG